MYKQYSVSVVVTDEIQKKCNNPAAEGWQLVTAYKTDATYQNCFCKNTKESEEESDFFQYGHSVNMVDMTSLWNRFKSCKQ